MRTLILLCLALLLPCTVLPAEDADVAVLSSRIDSIGLFKNGLAVVRRTVELPATEGRFEIADLPEPVHGTFWVESDVHFTMRVRMREVEEVQTGPPGADLQEELAGTRVTIHFRNPEIPAATGVVRAAARAERSWNRDYESARSRRAGWWAGNPPRAARATQPGSFLVLDTDRGEVLIDRSMIGYLRIEEGQRRVWHTRPVLEVELGKEPRHVREAKLEITYLTKGIAWAPSYRVDLTDPETLRLVQKAVVRNELEDLTDVPLELISGFPNVEFAHVLSPLAPDMSWSQFFQQLGQSFQAGHNMLSNVTQQRAVSYRSGPPMPRLAGIREGVDLHYHEVGAHTLAVGDSLMLMTGEGSAPYERLVEWIVPDRRAADGRLITGRNTQTDAENDDSPWDAIRFQNPLSFPMTTGPMTFMQAGRFQGEGLARWASPGEETTLRITRALSIRTRASEVEVPGKREVTYVGGRRFRETLVDGELLVCNHRSEDVQVQIRRRFSGDLVSADGEPATHLREEGVYSVNPRYEATWTLTLKPGEERTLKYRYKVLVPH